MGVYQYVLYSSTSVHLPKNYSVSQIFWCKNMFLGDKTCVFRRKNLIFVIKTLHQRFGANLKTHILLNFAANFLLFCIFFSFSAQKTSKIKILTSIWSALHPNTGRNIQQVCRSSWKNHLFQCIFTFWHIFFSFLIEFWILKITEKAKNIILTSERHLKQPIPF